MCINKIHTCNYCRVIYQCNLDDFACPTFNDDRDKNMCDSCRIKLEKRIEEDELDIAEITLEEIMEMNDD